MRDPLLLALLALTGCIEPPPPRTLVVHAGAQRVVVQDGTITAIAPDTEATLPLVAGAVTIDAQALTLCPGHVEVATAPSELASVRAAVSWVAAELARGVTTLAVLDTELDKALALRRYVGTGRHRGPRIFVSGPRLVATAGPLLQTSGRRALRTVAEARLAVQDLAEAQVDVIRLEVATAADAVVACAALVEARVQEVRVIAVGGSALGLRCEGAEPPSFVCSLWGSDGDFDGCPVDLFSRSAVNAHALGLDDALGQVRVGFRADLVAVVSDSGTSGATQPPPSWVMLDGVVQHLGGPAWYAALVLTISRWLP
ncbi:MAG: hypothetical protein AAB426_09480 [Myxococcota bacterium]